MPDQPRKETAVAIFQESAGTVSRVEQAHRAGDPFLGPIPEWPRTTIPEAIERQQTAGLAEDRVDQANFEERSAAAVAPADPWSTGADAQDGIKVPNRRSVNGRVGHFSVNYGMGQIGKP